MKEKIDYWLDYLPQITKDEAEFILQIVNLDDESRLAFKLAKSIFEDC